MDTINEDGKTVCGKCQKVLEEGSWPFCPHPLTGRAAAIQRDEIPGGMVLENGFKHPITVYSFSEMRRKHAEAGVRPKEKFCPMPGTDIDPQGIPNPKGYLDPKTLENAAILIGRNGARQEPEWDPREAGVLVGEFNEVVTGRDAAAVANGDLRRQSRLGRRTNGR